MKEKFCILNISIASFPNSSEFQIMCLVSSMLTINDNDQVIGLSKKILK